MTENSDAPHAKTGPHLRIPLAIVVSPLRGAAIFAESPAPNSFRQPSVGSADRHRGGRGSGIGVSPSRATPPRAEQRGIRPGTEALHPKPLAVNRFACGARWLSESPARSRATSTFFPLLKGNSLFAVLGKLRCLPDEREGGPALPEKLLTLRHEVARHYSAENWESRCPAWHLVVNQIRLAAHSGGPGTIRGEPGAGKRWVARAIHCQDPKRRGPFVFLDCARLPPQALTALIEDESRILRSARLGTLYLREPKQLPRDVQQRLCHWIDDADEVRLASWRDAALSWRKR